MASYVDEMSGWDKKNLSDDAYANEKKKRDSLSRSSLDRLMFSVQEADDEDFKQQFIFSLII